MSDTPASPLTPPTKTLADDDHQLARVAASVVIPAGGYLVDAVMAAPMAKRVDTWREVVSGAIRELQDQHSRTVEDLSNDEAFIDVVAQASRAAAFTSSEVKREALRNAILSAGASADPSDDEWLIFVRLVDELTEWHLKVLDYHNGPSRWFELYGQANTCDVFRSVEHAISRAMSFLSMSQENYGAIESDLETKGLLSGMVADVVYKVPHWQAPRTTPRGKRFLAFIRRP